MKKLMFFLLVILCISLRNSGQCPDKPILAKRISDISSSKLTPKEQVPILLKYLDTINQCPYKIDSTQAFLLRTIGGRFSKQGDFLKAIEYYQRSIDLINANIKNPAINPAHKVRGFFWLHCLYDSVNNIPAKMAAVDSCINLAVDYKIESSSECVRSLLIKVVDLYDKGDYHFCIDYAKMCEKLAENHAASISNPDDSRKVRIMASISLGWHIKALLELKRFDEAEKHLSNKIDEYTKAGFKEFLGFIYGELAEVEMSKGKYEKALPLFNKSLAAYRADKDYFNVKQVMKTIGHSIYYDHLHDYDKSALYFNNALALTNKNDKVSREDSAESLSVVNNLANVYVQKAMYDTAFRLFQRAFYYLKPGITEMNIVNIPEDDIMQFKKIHYIIRLMIDFGDAYLKKYIQGKQAVDVQRALQIYKQASLFLNRINLQQFDLESKLFWRSENRRLYENAIDACYRQGNSADAFYFFEKSRAVLLNNELASQQNLGAEMISKQVEVKKKILHLKKELPSSTGEAREEIQRNLFSFQNELDQLEQSIKRTNPLYYQTVLDTSQIRLSDAVNKLLQDHNGFLEIFSGDSAVYILALTVNKTFFKKINKVDYESAVDSYLSYLSNASLLNQDFAAFTAKAGNLYGLIFGNISIPKGRLIISTNGRYFPFEALVTNSSASSPAYLLNDYAVSYTYSARFLLNNFVSNSTVPAGSMLGVAPVQYSSNSNLASLNRSDESLTRISALLPGTHNLIGRKASKENFLKQFPNYKILQLYTHASDTSNQNEPVIHFADGRLYLSDLVPEKPPATQLVVLSACETGIGKLYLGEGIFSFSRGFAAFGVPSAISNLWSVDNIETYRITELFYEQLSENLPIDVALQKAKLEFLQTASKEKNLPYFWAATVLVGKTDPVKYDHPPSWRLIAATTGVAGLLLLAVWTLKFRRKTVRATKKTLMPA
jgi:CHAT domain-containing protein